MNVDTPETLVEAVLDANIVYHTALAETYDETQPHFRPENVTKVDATLAEMARKTEGDRLLDIGCGTGFVLGLASQHFKTVIGVDVTQAMLDRVPQRPGIETRLADTSDLPFSDNSFDACTAYSFLHHLCDLESTLQEAHRCLKPGGIFYSNADPNRLFWKRMKSLETRSDVAGFVEREVSAIDGQCEEIAEAAGLTAKQVTMAEFQKMELGGFDPDEMIALLASCGFSDARCHFEWYLGQGKIMHGQSESDAAVVEAYLREALPATQDLFKYISFTARKAS